MKRVYNTSESELTSSLKKLSIDYEFIDFKMGSLQDNFLIGTENGLLIMARERYLNDSSSCIDLTMARTDGDKRKLWILWEKFTREYDEQNIEE